ncbi:MAG: CRISPR-associated helicase Cas3' [Methylococcales bacterium]|nr:CRISPR-associated helicase Cas3' [Methylococcales bacterium]MDD5630747.1 CRISPR-associated helicase Cas3' [Methylococcales bacterium]
MTEKLYYRYWGKARSDNENGAAYHLLPYHCLDVAAVGWHLLAPDKPLCKQLAKQLDVEPEWLRKLFVFCLALHDLGKFAQAFQGLRQDLSADLVKANPRMSYSERHDSLGFCLWRETLQTKLLEHIPYSESAGSVSKGCLDHLEPWLEIVTGHHGMPPKTNLRTRNFFEVVDEQAAMAFVQDTTIFFLADFDFRPLQDKALKKRLNPVSWQLAGIAVLADWLGSNQYYFTYYDKPKELNVYWDEIALEKAKEAIGALPKTPDVNAFQTFESLFPFIQQPTPLQYYAIAEPLTEQPQLFILEDVTGAGKTEAALILTQRLMAQGLADGLYIALPTMATANAMYKRLGSVYRKFYQSGSEPSLILAHGARELSHAFQDSVVLAKQSITDGDYLNGKNEEDQELSATAYCNAWLADSRKKALLADVGVGTLDQALLAILPARHQSLRLLGLGHKVLLVDEVHAYDNYMQKLLNALLEAHARQGGSVILLSATLPQTMREGLVNAFYKGLGQNAPALSDPAPYPLATHTPAPTIEQSIDTREAVKRTVNIQRLNNEEEVIAQIKLAVAAGHCACWIRNTVKSARQSYQDLLDAGIASNRLSLFHSRFAMIDRQEIENRTLEYFGDDSTPEHRKGQLLIATQVVEQSLDLDFDVMITDLAPIDLIIQRAGRLMRHVRDAQGNRIRQEGAKDFRGTPTLYLFSPDPIEDADINWLKPDHAGTQAVYQHIGQLWLTAKLLVGRGQFTMPDDARDLIEGVYSFDAEEEIPDVLLDGSMQAESNAMMQKSMADLNVLKLNKGYTRSSGDWDEETRIPTRLTEEEAVSVALAIVENGQLKPYAKAESYEWALSTVKLPEHQWKKTQQQIPENLKVLIETLKTGQKALRWVEILPLEEGQVIYSSRHGFIG